MTSIDSLQTQVVERRWLRRYYFIRAAFSIAWVAAAFTVAQGSPMIAAGLLVIYPAWDAAANYLDAARSGGLGKNRMQTINVIVSVATTIAVIVALRMSMNTVLAAFGAWAVLSGLLQLGAAVGRWNTYGAQWVMILSGAQSALAGVFFIVQSRLPEPPSISKVAAYAALGAFYFLLSAIWLSVSDLRRKSAATS